MKLINCKNCGHKDCDRCGIDNITECYCYKEEKVEKIVVSNWLELREVKTLYSCIETKDSKPYISFGFAREEQVKLIQNEKNILVMVNCLNALGGNFEYKPVDVIDTLEKWEEFQERLAKDNFLYDRNLKGFTELQRCEEGIAFEVEENLSLRHISEKYDVDLKILKEEK